MLQIFELSDAFRFPEQLQQKSISLNIHIFHALLDLYIETVIPLFSLENIYENSFPATIFKFPDSCLKQTFTYVFNFSILRASPPIQNWKLGSVIFEEVCELPLGTTVPRSLTFRFF